MEDKKVHALIKSVLVKENMADGTVTIKNANVVISDGLMSEILLVTIEKPSKQLHLIIKIASADPDYRYIVKLLFTSEIYFYETIVPIFNNLQLTHTQKPFSFIPKFFKATKEECIILEDVTPRGFYMLDRKLVFNDDCMKLAIAGLGRFHALSLALQQHDKSTWDSLENGVDPSESFTGEVVDWFQASLKNAQDLFQATDPQITAKLKHLHDNFTSELKTLFTPSKKYPSVMVHMDAWCNNILFKFSSSSNQVEDVMLIDFQQVTKGSPVLDISFFLYGNGSADCIKNWKEMLCVYYDSLFSHAKALKCDLSESYSWDMFLDDWKAYSKYGIIKMAMGISMNPQQDEHMKAAGGETLSDYSHAENLNLKTVERIKGIILHAYEEDFL